MTQDLKTIKSNLNSFTISHNGSYLNVVSRYDCEQYANARIIETLEKCMCNCTYFFDGVGEQITICNRCSTIDKLKRKQEVQP
jgi:hypothetical protein